MLPTGNVLLLYMDIQLMRYENGESGRESRITLTITFLWLRSVVSFVFVASTRRVT